MASTDRTAKGSILVVDDEPLKRITLQIELTEAGYRVFETAEPKSALRTLDSEQIDVVVTDLKMPGMDGLTFLEHVKRRHPDVHVILMTAFGTVDTAVAAMKRGAYDYLTKPFSTEVLLAKLDHLPAYRQSEADQSGAPPETPDRLGRMIGRSHAMRTLFHQIRTAADSKQAVLIHGESGTGKELAAEAVHELSDRRAGPMIRAGCAGLDPVSLERELLGIPDNADVDNAGGVVDQSAGAFGSARDGTLYLDQVEEIPREIQAKLLRAIEKRETQAVDDTETHCPSVRLVCSTRRDLAEMAKTGEFREDLYYRLSAVRLSIPPLRDRRQDIPVLAALFMDRHAPSGQAGPSISAHALDLLVGYDWPGNARELEHVIRHAIGICQGRQVLPEHIPALGDRSGGGEHVIPFAEVGAGLTETVATIERQIIESALVQSDYNQAKAAQILGIPRTTLRDKIGKYGLNAGWQSPGGLPRSSS